LLFVVCTSCTIKYDDDNTIKKTNYVIFGNKKLADLSILINNEMIARTYETKFLSIFIQANLKWNTHIVQLKNKISKSVGNINEAKSLLATAHLKMLYLSLIEPYLTYCCIAWASPEKTTSLDAFYKLQKRAAGIIMFVHHLAHAEPLFRK